MGRTVTPGARRSNIRYVSPWCGFGVSGSVRKMPKARSAKAAREDQVFCPDSSQPASVRTARDVSEARSEPDSGSDQACAQITSPLAIDGSTRARCSAVAWSKRVGARRLMPFCETRPGAPAAQYSSSKTSHFTRSTPRPPYSSGQDTTDQRSACSCASHSRCAAKPSRVSREGSGAAGTREASHSRASARKDSTSSDWVRFIVRSIRCSPPSWRRCPCRRARDGQLP